MNSVTVWIEPSAAATEIRMARGKEYLLATKLPPLAAVRHARAAKTLLEGLSLWLDARLRVVLSVDTWDASFCLDLTDEVGHPVHSVFYEVEVVAPCRRLADRRRRTR